MTYHYTRHVFKKGKLVHRENVAISGVQLYHETGGTGRPAFLELINKWNRNGLLGPNQYLYIAL